MNNINYIYIIPLIATITLAIYTVLSGKNTTKDANTKYVVFTTVISILLGVLFITYFYEEEFKEQNKKLQELLSTSFDTKLDSLNPDNENLEITRERYTHLIDSLERQNAELNKILEDIKKQEKVIGEKKDIKNEINKKIKSNKIEIGDIKVYNKILNRNIIEKRKGYTSHGETSNFAFECPEDYKSDSLDLKLKFLDEKLISKIDYIYISFKEKTGVNRYDLIFDEIYSPQKGVNGFRVKNYFKTNKEEEVELEVGYVLKSERNKDYPTMEIVECKNY